MAWCTKGCQKWTTFSLALVFILVGILMAVFWGTLFDWIKKKELTLENESTKGFQMWKETPIPMYLEFYFFNWTNSEKVTKDWSIKPILEQTGPYVYLEHHSRKDIVFNDNNTLTYKTQKIWKFLPEKSNGSLSDKIVTVNSILASIGDLVKDKNIIVKKGINFFIEEKKQSFVITKTISEFIFEGYDDPLIDLARKLHIKGMDMPFDKFGWFYSRNGSINYDGAFNMMTGKDDIRNLGRIKAWNYNKTVSFYSGACAPVTGTSGELWYPTQDDKVIQVFSPDICGHLDLKRNGTDELFGIEGVKYTADANEFDNGTLHPDKECYVPSGRKIASGIRSVQACKFNAPAYVSYPHFYLADPSYRNTVEGMNPDPEKHTFSLSLEPSTGLPLHVSANLQINILIQNVSGITEMQNIKPMYFPMFWFSQKAQLTEDLSSQVKLLLIMPKAGNYTAYGIIGIGSIFLFVGLFITYRRGWKNAEDETLLSQSSFN